MSTKPLDKITKAYKGEMGEDFRKKTRTRINWIVNHTVGKKILDVGCSQGIVPIILGREGKEVDALDIAQESIDYAIEDLKGEHKTVQENVRFRVSNFMKEEALDKDYETVLLTEVLEHMSDPDSCLRKIHSLLKDDGRLIVTVPFGINDYFDHKRTYYYVELLDQLSACFEVEEIEYLGNWVGVVCYKKIEAETGVTKVKSYARESIELLEKAFYTVERDLVTKIEKFQTTLAEKNQQITNIQSVHQTELKKEAEKYETLLKQIVDQSKEFKSLLASLGDEQKKATQLFDENQKLQQVVTNYNIEVKNQIANVEREKQERELLFEKYQKSQEEIVAQSEELKKYLSILEEERKEQAVLLEEHKILQEKYREQSKELEVQIASFEGERKEKALLLTEYRKLQQQFMEQSIELESQRSSLEQEKMETALLLADYRKLEEEYEKQGRTLEHTTTLLEEEGTKRKLLSDEYLVLQNQSEEQNKEMARLTERYEAEKKEKKMLHEEYRKLLKQFAEQNEEFEMHKVNANKERREREKLSDDHQKLLQQSVEQRKEINLLREGSENEKKKKQLLLKENQLLLQGMETKDGEIQELQAQLDMVKGELFECLHKEETALQQYLGDLDKSSEKDVLIGELERKISVLERKYHALKSSKLGNLTLKYWKVRRDFKNRA